MPSEPTVLMTAAGAPGGPSIMESIRAGFRGDSWRCRLIACDMNPMASGLPMADLGVTVPPGSSEEYIAAIERIVRDEKVDLILPLSSMELEALSKNSARLLNAGARVLVSPPGAIVKALDKHLTYSFLEKELAAVVPRFELVKNMEALERAASNMGFPAEWFTIRPPKGKGSRGFRIITNKPISVSDLIENKPNYPFMEYSQLFSMLAAAGSMPELLITEYLPGEEFTVDALCRDGKLLCAVPRSRDKITEGIATISTVYKRDDLVECVRGIAGLFGFDYLVNVQFKFDKEGRPKLLEINPRIAGTVVASVAAGVNLPYMAIRSALGLKLNLTAPKYGTKIIRYWDHVIINTP